MTTIKNLSTLNLDLDHRLALAGVAAQLDDPSAQEVALTTIKNLSTLSLDLDHRLALAGVAAQLDAHRPAF